MNTEAIPMEQSMTTPNCKALFLGFMKLGLMGFGGVLPLAHRLIVEDQKWLTSALLHKPICKGFFSDIIFK